MLASSRRCEHARVGRRSPRHCRAEREPRAGRAGRAPCGRISVRVPPRAVPRSGASGRLVLRSCLNGKILVFWAVFLRVHILSRDILFDVLVSQDVVAFSQHFQVFWQRDSGASAISMSASSRRIAIGLETYASFRLIAVIIDACRNCRILISGHF